MMRRYFSLLLVTFGLSASQSYFLPTSASGQWTHWRGPRQNGSFEAKGLPATWSLEGENLAWRVPIGGRSTPIIMSGKDGEGRVYLLTRGGEGPTEHERVVALSLADGRVLWEYKMPIFFTDIPRNRIGWTSPAGDPETETVYVHGSQGLLLALDRDGKLRWSHSLTEEYGRFSGYGGRVVSPIVDEDLVILAFLNSNWGQDQGPMWHRYVAFDKRTGEVRWWSAPGSKPLDTTYSTPVVAVVNGVRLLIDGGGDGAVHALKVRTGEPVWHFDLSKRAVLISVVADGDRVYASHSEENLDTTTMGRLVCIDATGTGDVTRKKELWRIDALMAGYASPAFHDGKLYVVDNSSNLLCLQGGSGKKLWERPLGTVGKGSPVWADGKIYVTEVNGRFLIVQDGASEAKILDEKQWKSPDGTIIEVNGSPAIAPGRVVFCTRDETFALGPKSLPAAAVSAPSSAEKNAEPPVDPSEAPAHLQLVPADVVLRTGGSVKLRARLFNARGQFLREASDLALAPRVVTDGPPPLKGTIEGAQFTSDPKVRAQAGLLDGKAGGLAASVRVRVLPQLPINIDFEPLPLGKVPGGWIGMSPLKFRIEEKDGSKVLHKLSSNALFMRSDVYFGLPDMARYTIQGDFLGTYARRNLPDMGLFGCRYSFFLTKDQKQEGKSIVRMAAWLAMPRLQKDAAFDWKQDSWYRMKMRVDPLPDGKGVARGKVWPRSEPEPKEWTVEMEDPLPTFNGAPGFTTFSPGITERSDGPAVYIDNLQVVENKD